MYEAFFGLRCRPFSPLPRVETYIPLAPVREPLQTLIRCVEQKQGIGVLTAAAGAGKSLVCRLLQQRFLASRRTVLLTTGRFPTRRALLQAILFELKHPYVGLSEQEARLKILDLVNASPHPMNQLLLIVDEAHLLSPRGLEELRTLTDYEVDGIPKVSLILSGQLELEELLTEPTMNALNQRVGCHVCIEPLTFEESAQYVRERLRFAGNDGLTIFTADALHLICSASEGNTRRLNQLCDHTLLLAYAEEACPIDAALVRSALLDLRELPLHWNAPLDLTGQNVRNPLENFANAHHAERESLEEEPLCGADAELDTYDDSTCDLSDDEIASTHSSSSYEVGGSHEESSIDQLFQVEKFIVPSAFTRSTPVSAGFEQLPESPDEIHSSTFETAPPEGNDVELRPQESVNVSDSTGSTLSRKADITMGFEELIVEDAYAVIDRMCERSTPRFEQRSRGEASETTSATSPVYEVQRFVEPDFVASSQDTPVEADSFAEHFDDEPLDDTVFELNTDGILLPSDLFDAPVVELPPVLIESQILDFINEISAEVRQYRDPKSPTRPEYTGTDVELTDSDDRPKHQSLRQTLNWQFDIVEPESAEAVPPADEQSVCVVTSPAPATEAAPPVAVAVDMTRESLQAPESPQLPEHVTPPTDEQRRYAQLFTRLQRQRRRVEMVMNKERRTGAEAHLS